LNEQGLSKGEATSLVDASHPAGDDEDDDDDANISHQNKP